MQRSINRTAVSQYSWGLQSPASTQLSTLSLSLGVTDITGFMTDIYFLSLAYGSTCPKVHLPAAAAAKSLQLCLTLCDPIDSSPPGSPIPGILQARTLEWVAIYFSNAWKWKVKVKSISHVRLLTTTWTAAYQAPPSMGFARQEYWSGLPLPFPAVRRVLVKLRVRNR